MKLVTIALMLTLASSLEDCSEQARKIVANEYDLTLQKNNKFHSCSSHQAIDQLWQAATAGNYWLAQSKINNLSGEGGPCGMRQMNKTATIPAKILYEERIESGRYRSIKFAELKISSSQSLFTVWLINRRTGAWHPGVRTIMKERTENGINDILNELFK